jgi:steroid delta-isomerase-like uncharacterized protein
MVSHPEREHRGHLIEKSQGGDTVASHDNKASVARFYDEVLNQRKVDLINDLAIEDYVEHDPFPGQGNGRADLKARVQLLLSAFDPLRFTVDEVIEEGDKTVVRWTNAGTHSGSFLGIPATNKTFSVAGIDIHVMRDGRMAEHRHVIDMLGQMQQLGLIPGPDGGSR